MLRTVLKILAYLSILTSTRTSSSYLEPQSLVSYRRANAAAVAPGVIVPSSINVDVDVGIPANVQQFSDLSSDTIDGADVYDVQWRASNSPYFMPRLVNANSMLYTQLSSNNNKNNNNNLNNNNNNNNLNSNSNNNNNNYNNSNNNSNNNRRGSKKSRKSKKQQQESRINSSSSKQFYETHSKRRNSFSTTDIDDTNDQSSSLIDTQNHSNNNFTSPTAAKTNNFTSNEYPLAQVDGKLERELQELFGIEGARKYQEYQLQQQIMSEQFGKIPDKNDNLKETQRKRDGNMGAAEEMQDVSGAMINQMMSRTTRRQREYDVPLIRE